MNMLSRIDKHRSSPRRVPDSSQTEYERMLDGMMERALQTARHEVRQEIRELEGEVTKANANTIAIAAERDAALSNVQRAEAERDAANVKITTLGEDIAKISKRSEALEKGLTLEQSTLAAREKELQASIAQAKDQLSAATAEIQSSKERYAALEGETIGLRRKGNNVTPMPQAIPEFEITGVVYGGPNNRPVSAKISPVRKD